MERKRSAILKEYIFKGPAEINYADSLGFGSPCLLLHGSLSRWQWFNPIIAELSKRLHLYAIDLRGHGKSGRVHNGYELKYFISDIKLFIEKHIQKKAIIFGHSIGGIIAMMLAAQHNEYVSAIIVGDAPLSINALRSIIDTNKESATHFIHWLKNNEFHQIYNNVHDKFTAEGIKQCDPDLIHALCFQFDRTFQDYKPNTILPKIQCPILVIRGTKRRGSLISDEDLDHALTLQPNLSEIQIQTKGHMLLGNDNSELLEKLNLFLNEVVNI